jgi:type IV pilus assembly protein PilE
VIAIIGILTSFAIPLYTHHLVRAHRLEAEITLKKIAVQLEEFYTSHNTYEGVTLDSLNIDASHYYTFQLNSNEIEYNIAAKPFGTQVWKDQACGILTLNSSGEISSSGSGDVQECW